MHPIVEGKFIRIGSEKFYIKGVTYGTFAPDKNGDLFPVPDIIERDFRMVAERGFNAVRTYTVPPVELLNIARENGLKVMIGLPWEQHLAFLDSRESIRKIIQNVTELVVKCHSHSAILCYTIGNEIPAPMVRWYGEQKIARFLKKIYRAVKKVDPHSLVTYVNYPTTEYLHLPFLDFYCYNVYLETKEKLSDYLLRLHNLIGDKPLVLAEIGIDSLRNGTDRQAAILDWQVSTVFEQGCAGAFVFSWTDEWWRGGASIDDWDFGLVDRERNPKQALYAVEKVFKEIPLKSDKKLPRFSVVVCSYNGASTIRDTLEACVKLDYPDYEVIVVNDGSTDSTQEIAERYDVKLINLKNGGLSNARNTGIYESSGDIVAYIDDDAYPDPQWLKYLALAYHGTDFGGMGGPNIAPLSDGFIAECVANAPGRPVHVLHTDEIAEHIPGCNMSFRREVLLDVGGFDPVYTAAGDDVDICWRVQSRGYRIGFHPSAFVWHHCRNSLSMYWKQQKGYGKAEALLQKKWPERYNHLGHLTWTGYIYGNGLTKPLGTGKKRIFYGNQGSALFQSVYQPAPNTLKAYPLMPEWYLLILFLSIVSLLGIEWKMLLFTIPALILSVSIVIIQAGISASHADFSHHKSRYKRFKLWMLTTVLHVIQPVARLKGRITNGLTLWKNGINHLIHIKRLLFLPRIITHWSEKWRPMNEWLTLIESSLKSNLNKVGTGGEFDRWDIKNQVGMFASVKSLLTVEEHGMGKQLLRLRFRIIFSVPGLILVAAGAIISALTYISQNYFTFSAFLLISIILFLKILADASGALESVWSALNNLPQGIDKTINTEAEILQTAKVQKIPKHLIQEKELISEDNLIAKE